jgi:hypothetical protein
VTRWNDISAEDKRDFSWIEVTTISDVWPRYVKGPPREQGKPARRWEYRQFIVAHSELPSDLAGRLNAMGVEGWELVAVHPRPYLGTMPMYPGASMVRDGVSIVDMLYVLKREVPA